MHEAFDNRSLFLAFLTINRSGVGPLDKLPIYLCICECVCVCVPVAIENSVSNWT